MGRINTKPGKDSKVAPVPAPVAAAVTLVNRRSKHHVDDDDDEKREGKKKEAKKEKKKSGSNLLSIERVDNRPDSVTSRGAGSDHANFNIGFRSAKLLKLASSSKSNKSGKLNYSATGEAVPESVAYPAFASRGEQVVCPEGVQSSNIRGPPQRSPMGNNQSQISDVTFHPGTQWNIFQSNVGKERERIEREIDSFVKKSLFRGIKFITCPTEMAYTLEKQSICQYSCQEMNIQPDERFRFWSEWNRRIEQSLCRRRSDVNTAMKKAFLGN